MIPMAPFKPDAHTPSKADAFNAPLPRPDRLASGTELSLNTSIEKWKAFIGCDPIPRI